MGADCAEKVTVSPFRPYLQSNTEDICNFLNSLLGMEDNEFLFKEDKSHVLLSREANKGVIVRQYLILFIIIVPSLAQLH